MRFHVKRKKRFWVHALLLSIICIHLYVISFSQPANDNCLNASVVNISNSGFGLGIFSSSVYDISAATVQPGETFAPAILVAGLSNKSIWYKFSIPTTRSVRVTLAQPGTAITAGDAGFTVYRTANCFPTNANISQELTPIGTFGNTLHPCVPAGDYFVQVTGNGNANGPLYIQIGISDTTGAVYDHPWQAYNFGTLSHGIKAIDYNVDCQSIEDASETCPVLSNSSSYNKSSWHVFKTPAYFDYLAIMLASPNGNFSNGANNTIGYTLYRGDARTTPISALAPVASCDSFFTSGYYLAYHLYKCSDLQPDSAYSIQLFFRDNFKEQIRLAISLSGIAPTQAPEPILSAIPPSNNLGVLPSSPAGQTTSVTDYFGCNSRHSIHPCDPSLPGGGINYYPYSNYTYNYNLSTFYTFTLSATSNVDISTSANCWSTYIRLFKQGPSNACSSLDTVNIVSQSQNSINNITCLDPGNYTLQISGSDTNLINNSYWYYGYLYNSSYPLCLLGNLGSSINTNITVRTTQTNNKFSLNVAGAFDTMNVVAGTIQPLQNGAYYNTHADTLGCTNTVLPADTVCTATNKKAIYREFLMADSGIVSLYNYSYHSVYNYQVYLYNKLYKGDANALAIAQNAHSYPQRIAGLNACTECLLYNYYYPAKACVVPGTYTHAVFGDETNTGYKNNPAIQFDIVNTTHNSPANTEDLGDILSQIPPNGGSMASSVDYFSCKDNVVSINGYVPCIVGAMPATKAIYRQFYLSSASTISITSLNPKTLFYGKITDGIAALLPVSSPWQCFSSASSTNNCLPPGWYTIISYSGGPSYQNPLQNYDMNFLLGTSDQITISACPGPKYNRPYKAAIDTITHQPFLIQWGPRIGSTAAYPVTDTTYTLYTEHYNCTVDTPFVAHPIPSCDPQMTKVAYYVFKTTQESYVQITINDQWGAVYQGDVRSNSASFATVTPIQPCVQGTGNIQLCRLQPGTYTLVIFAAASSNSCTSVTPSIYIDKTGYSRFDHANNAYDFGMIPPDSLYHNGKVGDINPLDAGRAPSNDFFYCTTGSRPNDPTDAVCGQEYNANIYSGSINNFMYPAPNANGGNTIPRRNLWYTFVLNYGGNIKVKVSNKTSDKPYQYKFAVYKSDVNGSLPFSTVVSTGVVDSTINQGLSFIVQNQSYYWCFSAPDEVSFYRDPCSASVPERYYILVENTNSYPQYPSGMYPNSQAEVSILLDSVNTLPTLFDHYSQASNIGSSLGPGTYNGQTDNFSCATLDATDPLNGVSTQYCRKTLWYKFSVSVTGNVRYRVRINNSDYYDNNNIQLFRQTIPGDSTSIGLQYYPNNSVYDNTTGYWASNCISPGTYYMILPGCSRLYEYVYPEIEIIEQAGDFCSAPVVATLNGTSNNISSVLVDCHTIGTDYGEFNPTVTCPIAGITTNYKTSWFRIDITGTDTVDVTTYLIENTNAQPSDIKYRLMNGDCNAMQERSCVQDAQTQDTYKCLVPGSYYVQVFTPVLKNGTPVTGTIDLHLNAVLHADTCAPVNNCLSTATFIPQFNCNASDLVTFVNYSTYGSSIQYNWNFGYNGQTSAAVAPQFSYPVLSTSQTYTVSLTVLNTGCGGQSTYSVPVTIPGRPNLELGNDTSLCTPGSSLLLNAATWPGSTYLWQDGSTNSTFNVNAQGAGTYYVTVTYNGCAKRDTIQVNINPITAIKQNKVLCGNDSILLQSYRGYNETYLWNTGSTNSSIYASASGAYINTINWRGCITRDTFNITMAVPPFSNHDTTKCNPFQSFTLDVTAAGAQSYSWQNGSTNPLFTVTSPGLYWVNVNYGNCFIQDTIQVYEAPATGTDSVNAFICAGQTYTLPWGASVNTGGIYKDTLHSILGCDSLRRIVNLTVQAPVSVTTSVNICQGQTYTLPWGAVVSTAGIYQDTLHYAVTGCDSLRRIVNLTVQAPASVTTNPVICAGQTYTLPWGTVVNSSDVYRDTLHYTTGCDSLRRIVNLIVQSSTSVTTNPIICAGQTYILPWGTIVNSSGTYRDTLHYTTGCDSLRRIVNLTVQAPTSVVTNPIICAGQTYTLPWGTVVSTAGLYQDTLHYTTGCDSIRRAVNLAVQSSLSATINATICAGQTYTLPSGVIVSAAGVYQDTLHYTTGCDSLRRTVNITVQSSLSSIINTTICAGQTYTLPTGVVVSAAGVYWDTLHYTITGCDSLRRTVNLAVQTPASAVTNPIICAGQTYTLPWGTVVNTAGIYRDTLHYTTGCDSIWRTVNLTVQSSTLQTTNPIICAGQTYTLPWGTVVSTTGVYRDTLRYTTGCDSVRRVVILTVQSSTLQTTNPIICTGQTYTLPWGAVVNTAGIYSDTLHYTTGCDSVRRIVNLTVQSSTLQTTNPIICSGQTYTLPWGTVVNTAGIYRDTLHYTTGCDSIWRTVNLTVQLSTLQTTNPIICAGQTYALPWGTVVSTAGIYQDTLRYTTGCDSVRRTVNLTVQSSASVTTNPFICAGQTYTLPWGIIVNATGVYRDTLHYATGCDSIRRTVNLTVQSPTSLTVNPIICAGQTYTLPSGTIVNTAGVYRDTLHYSTGCDSIRRTVNLTVQTSSSFITSPVICSGQTYTLPWGAVVNSSGVYRDTLHYATGCDSIRRIVNLTVQLPASVTTNPVICQGANYTLPWGVVVNTAGTYRDTLHYTTGCDSIRRTVNLQVRAAAVLSTNATICSDEIYTLPWGSVTNVAGVYNDTVRTTAGCDSLIRTVNLRVDPAPSVSVSKSNDVDCMLGIAKLEASGGVRYTWTPSASLNNAAIYNPVASPSATTWYRVMVTSDKGCTTEDSVQVKVIAGNIQNGYLVPNAFTPNGDGKNDCFGVQTWGYVTDFSFSIFNRWGQRIFYTTKSSDCWDGMYRGKEQNPDVYVYQIKAKGFCGDIYRKGTFALIR